ncbi:hypothetical protein CYMTET_10893, partial [Cymbomonas tetramitiformis]
MADKVNAVSLEDDYVGITAKAEKMQRRGRHDEAQTYFRAALKIKETEHGKDSVETVPDMNMLARALEEAIAFEGARPLYERSAAILEKAVMKKSNDAANIPALAATLNNLGLLLKKMGVYEDAFQKYSRSISLYEMAYGEDCSEIIVVLDNLAVCLQYLDRFPASEIACKRSVEIRKQYFGPAHPEVADALNWLAAAEIGCQNHESAEAHYWEALSIDVDYFGQTHENVARTLMNLGALQRSISKMPAAASSLKRAKVIWDQSESPVDKRHSQLLRRLAEVLCVGENDFQGAETCLKEAIKIDEALAEGTVTELPSMMCPDSLNAYGELLLRLERFTEAKETFQYMLKIISEFLGNMHPLVGCCLNNIGIAQSRLNDHDGAIVSFKDALEIRERELGHVSLDVGQTVMNLAGAFTGTGFYAEAEPLLLRAMDIHRKNNI